MIPPLTSCSLIEKERSMATFTTNDNVTLYYEDHGSGLPIVFVNGWNMSMRWWHKQIPVLTQKYRVITLDARGTGRSEKATHGYRLSRLTHDLHELLNALDLSDVLLVGWSLGVHLVFSYLELFGADRVRGLVLIDQSPCNINGHGWNLGAGEREHLVPVSTMLANDIGHMVPLMFVQPRGEEDAWMIPSLVQTALPAEPALHLHLEYLDQDWRDLLPTITVPTLVVFGKQDRFFPWQAGAYIADHVAQGRLVTFEQSAHCPFYEEAERFNQEVLEFAASLV
jgi:non-heme chloroperoxidase